jgi:hypothetical protein
MNEDQGKRTEEFRLSGGGVMDKIKHLIHETNVRRIILKSEEGKVYLEIPLAVGLVGTALLPILAAVGALVALVARVVLVVERVEE